MIIDYLQKLPMNLVRTGAGVRVVQLTRWRDESLDSLFNFDVNEDLIHILNDHGVGPYNIVFETFGQRSQYDYNFDACWKNTL